MRYHFCEQSTLTLIFQKRLNLRAHIEFISDCRVVTQMVHA